MGNKDFDEWWVAVSRQAHFLGTRAVAHSAWVEAQRPLKAKIAELEEQMEAIGAGGVTRGQRLMYRLVNGVKVPVFPDWEPALGETVFVVDVTHAQFFYEQEWIGDELDLMYLDRGLVYPATTGGECAAELHSKAMLGLVAGEQQDASN